MGIRTSSWLSRPLSLRALMLFGYLFPWMVAAYYLMKSREVAS